MSFASYRRNERLGVTGPHKPTCCPATFEQLSPNHSYRPRVYDEYVADMEWFSRLSRDERGRTQAEQEEIYNKLFRPLGGLTCETVIFKRSNTVTGLKRIVHKLILDECAVALEIYPRSWYITHTVGLIPTYDKDYFFLVSNQIPKGVQGLVTLDQLAPKMAYPEDPHMKNYLFNDANITALPPAA